MCYLNENNVIHQQQYGFLPNSCTTAAASCLGNDIVTSLNSSKKTAVLTLDIAKAFDCVSHEKLSAMFENIGIAGNSLSWLLSYFTNRSQVVYVEGEKSEEAKIKFGCPQGSVLGPLIFLLYVNGLFRLKLCGKLRLFADDAAVSYSAMNNKDLLRQMSEDLRMISAYLSTLHLRLNVKKTNFVIFTNSPKVKPSIEKIPFNNEYVMRVESFKYLGVFFDQNLSWKLHAQNVLKKITPYISILSKIRHYLNKKTLMTFYYAHIHSRLTYCLPVWQGINTEYKNLIQRAQNKAIKLINSLPPLTPTKELYDGKLLKFSDHIKYENILFIYKIFNGLMRCDLKLGTNIAATSRVTRQANLIRTPAFISNKAQASIFYRGIVEYNQYVKNCEALGENIPKSLGLLKSGIKNFVRQL